MIFQSLKSYTLFFLIFFFKYVRERKRKMKKKDETIFVGVTCERHVDRMFNKNKRVL